MHRPTRTTAAALLGSTLIGAGAGAGVYAATDSGPKAATVTVAAAASQAAATRQTGLTANQTLKDFLTKRAEAFLSGTLRVHQ